MTVVIPGEFTLTTGIFGTLKAIGRILISMRKYCNSHKKICDILDRCEASLGSIRELLKQAAGDFWSPAIRNSEFLEMSPEV